METYLQKIIFFLLWESDVFVTLIGIRTDGNQSRHPASNKRRELTILAADQEKRKDYSDKSQLRTMLEQPLVSTIHKILTYLFSPLQARENVVE